MKILTESDTRIKMIPESEHEKEGILYLIKLISIVQKKDILPNI